MSSNSRKRRQVHYTTAMVQLPLLREMGKQEVRTPKDVWDVCSDITQMAQEVFQVLTLSAKNHLLNRHLTSLGTADASLVHPREVFRPAICDGASGVILVHNHPSGDVTPSAEDIRITRQLIEAGKIIDIKVLDHVILGHGDNGGEKRTFLSLREEGLCQF